MTDRGLHLSARPLAAQQQARLPQVVIRTLPLAEGNYGGILQAYALQEFIASHGVNVVTDSITTFRVTHRWLAWSALTAARGKPDRVLPPGVRNEANSRIRRFVASRMRTVDDLAREGLPRRAVLAGASVAIAGSDQVWRRAYGRVLPYLFADLDRPDLRLLSFAASFGRDDLNEYSARLLRESARLAGRFHAVSVREQSGVALCREHWGVTAEQHLDPVFLFDGDHYRALTRNHTGDMALDREGALLAYVLDGSPQKSALIADATGRLGLHQSSLKVPVVASRRAYLKEPQAYLRPTVEDWVDAFVTAEFVITDSFHGTALSILLNKPFVALVNQNRGAVRFTSVLTQFGLGDRLWTSPLEPLPSRLLEPIDWDVANDIAQRARTTASTYLMDNVMEACR